MVPLGQWSRAVVRECGRSLAAAERRSLPGCLLRAYVDLRAL